VLVAVMAVFASCSSSNSGAPVCEPLSQACPDGGAAAECVTDWASAHRPATWCATLPSVSTVGVSHCDGFDIVGIGVVDTSSAYYYDPQSGALVGMRFDSKDGHSCFGQTPEESVLLDCADESGSPSVSCESVADGGG